MMIALFIETSTFKTSNKDFKKFYIFGLLIKEIVPISLGK